MPTLDLALGHRGPRLLSDNGSSYISDDLAKWLQRHDMAHVRGAPRWRTLALSRRLLPRYIIAWKLGTTMKAEDVTATLEPRVERGYLYCGPSGSGHFVKMIHNGIEYGIMQAYAEGFEIMQKASSREVPEERRYNLDIADIAEVWRRGSVISSWLLDLTAMSLAEDPALSKYSGLVEDSGEGRWTVNTAIEEAVPADVLSAALFARFRSRDEGTANKLLSTMRHAFGGHVEPK
jgi:6-phosphogluconate dehydrogenase (decarboxylating)